MNRRQGREVGADERKSWLYFREGATRVVIDGRRCPRGILSRTHWTVLGTPVPAGEPNTVCACPPGTVEVPRLLGARVPSTHQQTNGGGLPAVDHQPKEKEPMTTATATSEEKKEGGRSQQTVVFVVDGKRTDGRTRQYTLGYLAQQHTAGIVEGRKALTSAELRALLAELGVEAPETTTGWKVTLPNGKVVEAAAPAEGAAPPAPRTAAKKAPAKKAPPKKAPAAKKATAKKAPAKRTPAKKAPAKKSADEVEPRFKQAQAS